MAAECAPEADGYELLSDAPRHQIQWNNVQTFLSQPEVAQRYAGFRYHAHTIRIPGKGATAMKRKTVSSILQIRNSLIIPGLKAVHCTPQSLKKGVTLSDYPGVVMWEELWQDFIASYHCPTTAECQVLNYKATPEQACVMEIISADDSRMIRKAGVPCVPIRVMLVGDPRVPGALFNSPHRTLTPTPQCGGLLEVANPVLVQQGKYWQADAEGKLRVDSSIITVSRTEVAITVDDEVFVQYERPGKRTFFDASNDTFCDRCFSLEERKLEDGSVDTKFIACSAHNNRTTCSAARHSSCFTANDDPKATDEQWYCSEHYFLPSVTMSRKAPMSAAATPPAPKPWASPVSSMGSKTRPHVAKLLAASKHLAYRLNAVGQRPALQRSTSATLPISSNSQHGFLSSRSHMEIVNAVVSGVQAAVPQIMESVAASVMDSVVGSVPQLLTTSAAAASAFHQHPIGNLTTPSSRRAAHGIAALFDADYQPQSQKDSALVDDHHGVSELPYSFQDINHAGFDPDQFVSESSHSAPLDPHSDDEAAAQAAEAAADAAASDDEASDSSESDEKVEDDPEDDDGPQAAPSPSSSEVARCLLRFDRDLLSNFKPMFSITPEYINKHLLPVWRKYQQRWILTRQKAGLTTKFNKPAILKFDEKSHKKAGSQVWDDSEFIKACCAHPARVAMHQAAVDEGHVKQFHSADSLLEARLMFNESKAYQPHQIGAEIFSQLADQRSDGVQCGKGTFRMHPNTLRLCGNCTAKALGVCWSTVYRQETAPKTRDKAKRSSDSSTAMLEAFKRFVHEPGRTTFRPDPIARSVRVFYRLDKKQVMDDFSAYLRVHQISSTPDNYVLPRTTFSRVWKQYEKEHNTHLQFQQIHSMASCGKCIGFNEILSQTNISLELRNKTKAKQDDHLSLATEQRDYFERRKLQAMEMPWNLAVITMDGMDQAKTNLPHSAKSNKDTEHFEQLQVRVTGAICFGFPMVCFGILGLPNVNVKGAAASITMLDMILDQQFRAMDPNDIDLSRPQPPSENNPMDEDHADAPATSAAAAAAAAAAIGDDDHPAVLASAAAVVDVAAAPAGSADATPRVSFMWPRTLHMTFDNTSADCKNSAFFIYLAMLVMLGVFVTISVSTLIVGHTHDIVDQMFAVWAICLNKNQAGCLEELRHLFRNYSSNIYASEELKKRKKAANLHSRLAKMADVLGMQPHLLEQLLTIDAQGWVASRPSQAKGAHQARDQPERVPINIKGISAGHVFCFQKERLNPAKDSGLQALLDDHEKQRLRLNPLGWNEECVVMYTRQHARSHLDTSVHHQYGDVRCDGDPFTSRMILLRPDYMPAGDPKRLPPLPVKLEELRMRAKAEEACNRMGVVNLTTEGGIVVGQVDRAKLFGATLDAIERGAQQFAARCGTCVGLMQKLADIGTISKAKRDDVAGKQEERGKIALKSKLTKELQLHMFDDAFAEQHESLLLGPSDEATLEQQQQLDRENEGQPGWRFWTKWERRVQDVIRPYYVRFREIADEDEVEHAVRQRSQHSRALPMGRGEKPFSRINSDATCMEKVGPPRVGHMVLMRSDDADSPCQPFWLGCITAVNEEHIDASYTLAQYDLRAAELSAESRGKANERKAKAAQQQHREDQLLRMQELQPRYTIKWWHFQKKANFHPEQREQLRAAIEATGQAEQLARYLAAVEFFDWPDKRCGDQSAFQQFPWLSVAQWSSIVWIENRGLEASEHAFDSFVWWGDSLMNASDSRLTAETLRWLCADLCSVSEEEAKQLLGAYKRPAVSGRAKGAAARRRREQEDTSDDESEVAAPAAGRLRTKAAAAAASAAAASSCSPTTASRPARVAMRRTAAAAAAGRYADATQSSASEDTPQSSSSEGSEEPLVVPASTRRAASASVTPTKRPQHALPAAAAAAASSAAAAAFDDDDDDDDEVPLSLLTCDADREASVRAQPAAASRYPLTSLLRRKRNAPAAAAASAPVARDEEQSVLALAQSQTSSKRSRRA